RLNQCLPLREDALGVQVEVEALQPARGFAPDDGDARRTGLVVPAADLLFVGSPPLVLFPCLGCRCLAAVPANGDDAQPRAEVGQGNVENAAATLVFRLGCRHTERTSDVRAGSELGHLRPGATSGAKTTGRSLGSGPRRYPFFGLGSLSHSATFTNS